MGLYDYTLYSVIKRNAKADGNRVAFLSGKRITYQQFWTRWIGLPVVYHGSA
jgi:hypothetical protein